ncbi:MAG: D-alanyl-D-alanine carboxypeptidase family protein [Acetobacteraceae bacterium]
MPQPGPALAFRVALFLGALLLLAAPAALAQIGSERYAAIVTDARTGRVLIGANERAPRHPASLTKVMTAYMTLEAVRAGRLRMNQRIVMTEEAASRPPSKLGIRPGTGITVQQALSAILTRSANDVAALLGEVLGGSEERFAQMMTRRARELGMTDTVFRNASGLPDDAQVTTAHDMALLARRLIQDFPDFYHLFGQERAQVAGSWLRNHNRMLTSYEGADGIKTGFIRASGFNIVTSAVRGGQRLIVVVFGGQTWMERDEHAAELLDRAFARLGVPPRTETMVAAAPRTGIVGAARAATPAAAARPAVQAARTQTQPARQAQARPGQAPAQPRQAAQPARQQTAARPAQAQARPAAAPAAVRGATPAAAQQRRAVAPPQPQRVVVAEGDAAAPRPTGSALARPATPLPPPQPRR